MIEFAKLVHQAIGTDSPRVFVLAFALFGAVAFGSLGWLIDKSYRVSKQPGVTMAASLQESAQQPKAESSGVAPSHKTAKQKPTSPNIHLQQHSSGPDSPNVATFGPNSPVTINPKPNPYAPTVWYESNGVKHSQKGSEITAERGEETKVFQNLLDLQDRNDWATLRDVCEKQMKQSPEWLTPYLFAGIAYAQLGNKQRATELLTYVEKQSAGAPDYSDAGRILEELRK